MGDRGGASDVNGQVVSGTWKQISAPIESIIPIGAVPSSVPRNRSEEQTILQHFDNRTGKVTMASVTRPLKSESQWMHGRYLPKMHQKRLV